MHARTHLYLVFFFAAETGNGKRGVFVDAICPAHCQTDMGGPDAPRTAEQGAETILWLASREVNESTKTVTVFAVFHTSRNPKIWNKRQK